LHDNAEQRVAVAGQVDRIRKRGAELIDRLRRHAHAAVVDTVNRLALAMGHPAGQRGESGRRDEEHADGFALQKMQRLAGDGIEVAVACQGSFGEALRPARVEVDAEGVQAVSLPSQLADDLADNVWSRGAYPQPGLPARKARCLGDAQEWIDEGSLEFVV